MAASRTPGSASRAPVSSARLEHIIVHESDFRKYRNDLSMLRRCQLSASRGPTVDSRPSIHENLPTRLSKPAATPRARSTAASPTSYSGPGSNGEPRGSISYRIRQPRSSSRSEPVSVLREAELESSAHRDVDRFREAVLRAKDKVQQSSCDTRTTSRIRLVDEVAEAESPSASLLTKPVPAIVGRVAVWVSLNPRNGRLQVYSRAAAARLEEAYWKRRTNVPLCGLERCLEDAVVLFDEGISPVQRTLRGARDVRRLELGVDEVEMPSLHVVHTEGGWRISEFALPGIIEQRFVQHDWLVEAVGKPGRWPVLPSLPTAARTT